MNHNIRLQLSSGRELEGALLFRSWPQLTLGVGDSRVALDAREITVLWQATMDKSRGSLTGAVVGAIAFGFLAAGFSGSILDEESSGIDATWVTIAGVAVGAGIGHTIGTQLSVGTPGWDKIYP